MLKQSSNIIHKEKKEIYSFIHFFYTNDNLIQMRYYFE